MEKRGKPRVLSIIALSTIGDGLMGLLFTKNYLTTWRIGPDFMRNTIDFFCKHVLLTKVLYAAQIALGIWMGSKVKTSPGFFKKLLHYSC